MRIKKKIPEKEWKNVYEVFDEFVGAGSKIGLRAWELWVEGWYKEKEEGCPRLTPGEALRQALAEFKSAIDEA